MLDRAFHGLANDHNFRQHQGGSQNTINDCREDVLKQQLATAQLLVPITSLENVT